MALESAAVNQPDRRDLYNGAGATWTRAFELVMTPMIFGGAGWLLDRWVGTWPVFTLVLFALCIVGLFVRAYYAYAADMAKQEANAPWARGPEAQA